MTSDIKPPAPRPVMRFVGTRFYRNLHRGVFRLTGGRVAGRINGMETVLLTTTGRKTGKERTVPLLYLEDGDALVVVASNSGGAHNPAWWFNIEATPVVSVETRGAKREMVARTATAAERERMWPRLAETNAFYSYYPQITDREMPLVYLMPVK